MTMMKHKDSSNKYDRRKSNSNAIRLNLLTGSSEKQVHADFNLITLDQNAVRQFVDISPFNPRFKDEEGARDVRSLAKDIKKNGQIEPVWAYFKDGKYWILNGSRRLTVTSYLNMDLNILYTSYPFSDQQLQIISLSLANTKELSLMEKGAIYYSMMQARPDMTLEDVSKAKGVSRTLVKSAIEAFTLPDYIKDRFNSPSSLGKPAVDKLSKLSNKIEEIKNSYKRADSQENKKADLSLVNAANDFICSLYYVDSDQVIEELTREAQEKYRFKLHQLTEKLKAKLNRQNIEFDPKVHTVDIEKPDLDFSETKINSVVIKEIFKIYKESDLYQLLRYDNNINDQLIAKENELGVDVIDVQTSRIVSGHSFDNKVSKFVVKNLQPTSQELLLNVHKAVVNSIVDARTPLNDADHEIYKQMLKMIGNTNTEMSSKEKGKLANVFMNILKVSEQSKQEEVADQNDKAEVY
ncbi:hypothetical protein UA32_11740 [Photobacterium angustum]|uniref:ParB/Sulfiredoxin domain-containing protein n=1 Tax=Photobacterium angustum TaxID=661 RepID=A0ABX5H1Z6_PHOAN|nr:ParB N-terminal domain-containing protein [Photobacterium angustum]KJG37633.1 hypothetical protein UA32_11740 [Photobacterium angustum]PSX07089.1 hypothetical protein C0W27_16090 [Photobacterium angustum]